MTSNFIPYLLTPIFISLFALNVHAQSDVLTAADEMPYFTGCKNEGLTGTEKRNCSNQNLVRFIANQLVYPSTAKEQGIEGTVYVTFIVDELGSITTPDIIRDIGGGCGAAALEVIQSMPSWEPGFHQGQAVKVKLNLPIHFSLKNSGAEAKGQQYQINWGSLATQLRVSKKDLQEQLQRALHVRDPYGDDKPITELIFAYERKRTYLEGSSAGKINDKLKKIVNKSKRGGVFTITAIIQIKGELIYVKRAFEVI